MPSSMIFTGLVAVWLVVLVPTVARHRQEVERPSVAALSGRVLDRRRGTRSMEGDRMAVREDVRSGGEAVDAPVGAAPEAGRPNAERPQGSRAEAGHPAGEPPVTGDGHVDASPGDTRPDVEDSGDGAEGVAGPPVRDAGGHVADGRRARPGYRPGRGGFDAEAAYLTARARYTARQRVVLVLLVAAVGTAVAAAMFGPVLWWVHGGLDVVLVGYLSYLRRQVRLEDAIRERRAARLHGPRSSPVGHGADGEAGHDEPQRNDAGRDARQDGGRDDGDDVAPGDALDRNAGAASDGARAGAVAADDQDADDQDADDQDADVQAAGNRNAGNRNADVRGAADVRNADDSRDADDFGRADPGDGSEPERIAGTGEPVGLLRVAPEDAHRAALPRLQSAPPPPLPPGTTLVEPDDAELALPEVHLPHRRAAGE